MIKLKIYLLSFRLMILFLAIISSVKGQAPCEFQVYSGDNIFVDLGDTIELHGIANIATTQISTVFWKPNIRLSCHECYSTSTIVAEDICYIFSVTDTTNCTVRDTVYLYVKTPQDELSNLTGNFSVKLQPNPTNGYLSIYINSPAFNEIEIYDISGKLIGVDNMNRRRHNVIDVSKLSKGVYFVKFISNNHFEIGKFVKN